MVELLIFLAMLGWAMVGVLDFLSSLAAFHTLAASAMAIPILTVFFYNHLLRSYRLTFLKTPRKFLPPERFYWPTQARTLKRGIFIASALTLVFWPIAIWQPATLSLNKESILGWSTGTAGTLTLSLLLARLWLFVQASQRFDKLTPSFVGALRRFMFWISDNYDFLGEDTELPKKNDKESVY